MRIKLLMFLLLLGFIASYLDFGALLSAYKAKSCAFCEGAVLDRQTFFQGERVLGILTHKPVAPGHVLIIPKRHVERFEDLTSEEVQEIGTCIRKVDQTVRNIFGHKDYLLLQKNGKRAGQSVPHVHFHYLPAVPFLSIKFFLTPWLKPLSGEELQLLQKKLSQNMNS